MDRASKSGLISALAERLDTDDLPGDLCTVASLVGVEKAVTIALHLGGVTVYLRKWSDNESNWSAEMRRFVDLIGVHGTKRIVMEFNGSHICIPKCEKLFNAVRDDLIFTAVVIDRNTLISQARFWHLSEKQIRNIVRKKSSDIPTRQESLFTVNPA